MFLAYLRGIETPQDDAGNKARDNTFLAYLRGIETQGAVVLFLAYAGF
ncbi:hypothetical protein CDSM653_02393 [Caldanaerobacter subterraneus subsp. pacificus DSM 12653]|uniref:Uncharacterized protein n=1 Tax=Caldanaerobacter subterraneus subsp. pacificus DSM 12653 TaxID=391606 RepID=A0A0F5PIZ7_9THEO|nr:hypothetical protein CDSM653_02389 [Caldanaerobacter subterraneus subsp. pacificus DSM 12653]KKC28626.1 hypothetical protein CDSM653_02393 [Caldanaerobacter subterraneus subsp. pacificus DSM 12653]